MVTREEHPEKQESERCLSNGGISIDSRNLQFSKK
jgi:hypothetical protein